MFTTSIACLYSSLFLLPVEKLEVMKQEGRGGFMKMLKKNREKNKTKNNYIITFRDTEQGQAHAP